jgi:hypothetical protein
VTDEAHFTDDLGADWLDRLELMIVIDRFADVGIKNDVDQEVVGDLIRHVENVDNERRRRPRRGGAAPVIRKLFGPPARSVCGQFAIGMGEGTPRPHPISGGTLGRWGRRHRLRAHLHAASTD